MISDAFDMTLTDDVVYEVDCKFITIKKGADVGSLHTHTHTHTHHSLKEHDRTMSPTG